jgi:hypothetical protein
LTGEGFKEERELEERNVGGVKPADRMERQENPMGPAGNGEGRTGSG